MNPKSMSVRSSHLFSEARKSTNGANTTNAVAGIICARVKEVREAKVASSPDIGELVLDGLTRTMNRRAATATAITIHTQKQILSHRGVPPPLILGVESCCRWLFSGSGLPAFRTADRNLFLSV